MKDKFCENGLFTRENVHSIHIDQIKLHSYRLQSINSMRIKLLTYGHKVESDFRYNVWKMMKNHHFIDWVYRKKINHDSNRALEICWNPNKSEQWTGIGLRTDPGRLFFFSSSLNTIFHFCWNILVHIIIYINVCVRAMASVFVLLFGL